MYESYLYVVQRSVLLKQRLQITLTSARAQAKYAETPARLGIVLQHFREELDSLISFQWGVGASSFSLSSSFISFISIHLFHLHSSLSSSFISFIQFLLFRNSVRIFWDCSAEGWRFSGDSDCVTVGCVARRCPGVLDCGSYFGSDCAGAHCVDSFWNTQSIQRWNTGAFYEEFQELRHTCFGRLTELEMQNCKKIINIHSLSLPRSISKQNQSIKQSNNPSNRKLSKRSINQSNNRSMAQKIIRSNQSINGLKDHSEQSINQLINQRLKQ